MRKTIKGLERELKVQRDFFFLLNFVLIIFVAFALLITTLAYSRAEVTSLRELPNYTVQECEESYFMNYSFSSNVSNMTVWSVYLNHPPVITGISAEVLGISNTSVSYDGPFDYGQEISVSRDYVTMFVPGIGELVFLRDAAVPWNYSGVIGGSYHELFVRMDGGVFNVSIQKEMPLEEEISWNICQNNSLEPVEAPCDCAFNTTTPCMAYCYKCVVVGVE